MRLDRKVRLPLAILGAGVLGVAIMVATRPRVSPRPPEVLAPLVRVIRAEPRVLQLLVHAQGTVVPRTESDLVPQVSGEAVWVSPNLVAGGFFVKGEPLVRIDRGDYETDLESARAVVARTRSELARAKTELDRQQRLVEQSAASQTRIDDAENAHRVAEAALREARARLARAERDLARTELRAPYEGRVRSKHVDVGQFVNRGAPIATLYAVDWAEVRLPLPDRELRYVDLPLGYRSAHSDAAEGGDGSDGSVPGPEVHLRAEFAGQMRTWTGHITRTEGEIDPKSRMVNAVARVEDPYGRHAEGDRPPLAVGLFVDAEILGRTVEGVYLLPRAALHGGEGGEGDRVYVVDDEGRLRFRAVRVLRTERERVVIEAGLAPGERVTISPLPAAVNGMAVRVAGTSEPAAAGRESALAGTRP